jgi:hypothetical protein
MATYKDNFKQLMIQNVEIIDKVTEKQKFSKAIMKKEGLD